MRAVDAGRTAIAGILSTVLLGTALAAGAGAADTDIKFTLDFRIEGPSAPFLLPLDKGYYKAEGLNVSFATATGSLEPIAKVASGAVDMGFGDINALIKFRDANPGTPVKAVFMVYNKPPFAIIGRKSRGTAKPPDLEGKKRGAPAADSAYAQWPIFAQANGIDVSKVTVDNVSFPVREPMLAAGQVDAITGFSFSSFVDLKHKGVPLDDVVVLLMADYGVHLYGNAVIVNPKFAAEHPDAVRGFLRALLKGLKETVKNPAGAIESVLKRNGQARKEVELERLAMAIRDNIVTPEVMANGYGSIDNDRMVRAIDQIGLTFKFRGQKPKPDDIFDASFLPPDPSRKVN